MTCVGGKSLSTCAYLCPQDTQEFIHSFHSETPLNRVDYTAQDFSLQERVRAQVETCSYPLRTAEVLPFFLFPLCLRMHLFFSSQLRAALYNIHDIFFEMPQEDRLALLQHDRELRAERKLREIVKCLIKSCKYRC